jgi:hypothetical protein
MRLAADQAADRNDRCGLPPFRRDRRRGAQFFHLEFGDSCIKAVFSTREDALPKLASGQTSVRESAFGGEEILAALGCGLI